LSGQKSVSDVGSINERYETSEGVGDASVGDFWALLKPRVMSLVVFTALVGLVLAPGQFHPVLAITALMCIAIGAGASGALNMWYDADIDADDVADCQASRSARPGDPRRGSRLRPDAVGRLGADPRADGELARRLAARLHDLLLCRRLHDVAEALDAAEHRHRRRRRRPAAGDRLGGGDGSRRSRAAVCCSCSSSCGRRRTSGRWRC
jgi:hypothetical protein